MKTTNRGRNTIRTVEGYLLSVGALVLGGVVVCGSAARAYGDTVLDAEAYWTVTDTNTPANSGRHQAPFGNGYDGLILPGVHTPFGSQSTNRATDWV